MAFFFSQKISGNAQALPIAIDSQFDDWTSEAVELTDDTGDGSNFDLLRLEVCNDEEFLFLQIEFAEALNLTDGNDLTIYLDTDQNANTGEFINNIGAELEIVLGERDAYYDLPTGNGFLDLHDLEFRHLPTVTSTRFEMAIDRQAKSNAGSPLFLSDGVRIFLKDEQGFSGDEMPESGEVFTYIFDESPTPPFEPIALEKTGDEAQIRLVTWNTLQNGLEDIDRAEYFDRVLGVLQPDIVTFNECWDMGAAQVASFMNAASPLPNFQSWNAVKLDQGNVTVSRWPILENWAFYPGHRLTASLIDLPDGEFAKDILVINAHFRCCEADFERQREADAFVEFILDAKTPGGLIDLPESTPFVLSGDLNLVGDGQQLTTLLTGDVVNSSQFGPGGPMDWDGTDLLDVIGTQADQAMAFTWENTFSSFVPSRIDLHIVSSNALDVEKTYVLNTEVMSNDRLEQYGLDANDTRWASDHLPKVTDLKLKSLTDAREVAEQNFDLQIFPNPTAGNVNVKLDLEQASEAIFILQNTDGQSLARFDKNISQGETTIKLDLPELSAGVYFLKMIFGNQTVVEKFISVGK